MRLYMVVFVFALLLGGCATPEAPSSPDGPDPDVPLPPTPPPPPGNFAPGEMTGCADGVTREATAAF